MIIVKLTGGLGNQLFQYAAGYALSKKLGVGLKIDDRFYFGKIPKKNYTYREYSLNLFHKLNFNFASKNEMIIYRLIKWTLKNKGLDFFTRKVTRKRYFLEKNPHYNSEIFNFQDNTYLDGYFQDERYFKIYSPQIKQLLEIDYDSQFLTRETKSIAAEIPNKKGICLHVRRGDYISNPHYFKKFGECDKYYYNNAIHFLSGMGINNHVYVFSDDDEWCRSHFTDRSRYTIVGNEHSGINGLGHFSLMTLCSHYIIPNSSFSWWAAWLNAGKDKIICRPNPWFINDEYKDADICPPEWIKIAR